MCLGHRKKRTLATLSIVFGETVRTLRKQKGYAQEKFANVCGINRTYMTDIELGRRFPTIEICRRICVGLDIELSSLFVALEESGYSVLSSHQQSGSGESTPDA